VTFEPVSPGDEAIQRWLTRQRASLMGGLADALNLEAGLQELLVPERHADLVDDLDDILDIETGLAAIVPHVPAANADPGITTGGTATGGRHSLRDLARRIRQMDNQSRLRIRQRYEWNVLDLDLRIAAALATANKLHEYFDPIQANELHNLIEHARNLAIDVQAFDVAMHLKTAHQLACMRNTESKTGELIDQVNTARILGHNHVEFHRRHARDEPVLIEALQLAFIMDLAVATDSVGIDQLTRARNDFTGLDLRTLDLADIRLEGVLWSTSTRWPPEREGQVRQDSVEIESGLFEVRGDHNHRSVFA
jgi:hypothetical protein